MLLHWDDSLTIDRGEIDRDHEHLMQLSNRFYFTKANGLTRDTVLSMMSEYIDYIAIHFNHEESIMERINYPDRDRHRAAHDKFFDRACTIMADYERKNINLSLRVRAYITTYAFNHIHTHDRALAAYCQDVKEKHDRNAQNPAAPAHK